MPCFFKTLRLDKPTPDEASMLVDPITEKEVKETIAKLKNNKSPGVDGFAGEYYKVFATDLTPVLCKLYNYVLKETCLNHGQRLLSQSCIKTEKIHCKAQVYVWTIKY